MSPNVQSQPALMTGAKQTMSAWCRVLASRDEIPLVYGSSFDRYFANELTFPNVIFTPALDKFPRRTTEKLICDADNSLYIFERQGGQVDVSCYPYGEISWTEVGIVLLDSWLTISGKTIHGTSLVSTIHFNTSSLRYFTPILKKLRPSSSVNQAHFAAEKDKFNDLSEVNFKFMNYGRESLVPGETVLQILLQEEIRQPRFTLFGRTFFRTVALAHLSTITDRELILIQDSELGGQSHVSRYGGVWQYLPLHCIDAVTLSDAEHDRLTLLIHCQPDKTVEMIFDATNRPELDEFYVLLRSLVQNARS